MSWSAYIYLVWKELNGRCHHQNEETPEQIVEHVKDIIRLRLAELDKVKLDIVNNILCRNWGLLDSIFD